MFTKMVVSSLRGVIDVIIRSYTISNNIISRAQLILELLNDWNYTKVAKTLATTTKRVRKWGLRFKSFVNNTWDVNLDLKTKKLLITSCLSDAQRSGTPPTFSSDVICQIMAMAVRDPSDYGLPITCWSLNDLTREVIKAQIVSSIDRSTIGRILQEADIRPHKSKYWLNPKIENEEEHSQRICDVCGAYKQSVIDDDIIVYSIDEKTGIQALEKIHPTKGVLPGSPVKIEYEYYRHGTLSLTPSFNIATGCIDVYTIAETRNEMDFSIHIKHTIENSDKKKQVIFIMDQLNTHKSESLVRLLAKVNGFTGDLGTKGKIGILKSMKTRQEFLEDTDQRVRIIFTPKHCSWMNQIEIWFGVLSRKLLARLSCKSQASLQKYIERFITFFNETLAKPYRWTYAGKALKQ